MLRRAARAAMNAARASAPRAHPRASGETFGSGRRWRACAADAREPSSRANAAAARDATPASRPSPENLVRAGAPVEFDQAAELVFSETRRRLGWDWHLWHLFLACWPPGLLYLFARHVETGDETLQLERANVAAAVAAAADADATDATRATHARRNPALPAAASSASANDETFDDLRRRMLEMETFLPLLREQRRRWLDAKEAGDDATDGDGGGADGRVDAREEVEESRPAGGFARRRSRIATWFRRGGRRAAEDGGCR